MSDPKDTAEYDEAAENQSWLEICDEELADVENESPSSAQSEFNRQPLSFTNKEIKTEFPECSDSEIKKDPLTAVKCEPNIADTTIEEGEIRSDLDDTVVEKESVNDDGFASSAAISNILSYAKVLSRGTKPENASKRKFVSDVPTEDLSLTSHLDIFHVDSPCKEMKNEETEIELMLDEDTVMFSPVKKEENPAKNMKRPFRLIDSPVQNKRERTSSIRSTHKVAKSNHCFDVHSSQASSSSSSSKGSPSSKRELEVNPDILARRQKQIDYGKSTVGYRSYCELVPKHKRKKEHPKTPPKHLKLSRRAWDGLVKNWRLKLHKWDPANGHDDYELESVNSDQYSLSSEVSSNCDSSSVKSDSTPSTPSQPNSRKEDGGEMWSRDRSHKTENPKELWPNCPQKSDKSDDDDYLGCESLNENCVKACS